MIREAKEEIGVIPIKYEKMGVIEFLEYLKAEKVNLKFHLYIATQWRGIPRETEEMKPFWLLITNIPYQKMFVDDKYWLPLVLEGKKIKVFFEFDEKWNLENYKIENINV